MTEIPPDRIREIAPHGVYKNTVGWWVPAGPGRAGRVCVERLGLTPEQAHAAANEKCGTCGGNASKRVWVPDPPPASFGRYETQACPDCEDGYAHPQLRALFLPTPESHE